MSITYCTGCSHANLRYSYRRLDGVVSLLSMSRAVGCIFGELLNHYPIMPGRNELDQIKRFCNLLGAPNEKIWCAATVQRFGLVQFNRCLAKLARLYLLLPWLLSPPPLLLLLLPRPGFSDLPLVKRINLPHQPYVTFACTRRCCFCSSQRTDIRSMQIQQFV